MRYPDFKKRPFKKISLFLLGLLAFSGLHAEMTAFEQEALHIARSSKEKSAHYQNEAEALKRESFKKLPPFKKGFSCKGEFPQEGTPQEGLPQKHGGCKGGVLPSAIVDEILEESGALPFKREGKQGEKRFKLYIFVSLSMPKETLFALGKEAKKYGATLVLQGFKGGDFKKTFPFFKEYLEQVTPKQVNPQEGIPQEGGGLSIDPPLFKRFKITLVPTFVLEEEGRDDQDRYDMVKGMMSLSYALSLMAEKGDLKEAAERLLKEGRS